MKRDHEKGNSIFPFATQSVFMDKVMKKILKLVTCLLKLQRMFTDNFLIWPFESGNWNKKGKKQSVEYLKNKKWLLEEIKTIFHEFEMLFFGKI